ncbi:hypothetical protein NL676_025581 [Syzygium grande]|nr:hypothetical protein NL676_025581 [Syzygium grande]
MRTPKRPNHATFNRANPPLKFRTHLVFVHAPPAIRFFTIPRFVSSLPGLEPPLAPPLALEPAQSLAESSSPLKMLKDLGRPNRHRCRPPPILVAAACLLLPPPQFANARHQSPPRAGLATRGAPPLGAVDEDRGKAEATPNGERRGKLVESWVRGV